MVRNYSCDEEVDKKWNCIMCLVFLQRLSCLLEHSMWIFKCTLCGWRERERERKKGGRGDVERSPCVSYILYRGIGTVMAGTAMAVPLFHPKTIINIF